MNEVNDGWTLNKQLHQSIESLLLHSSKESNIASFESILRKHRSFFTSILSNPPKNDGARKEIQQGITSGINLPGLGQTTLAKDLVDEAIIISDMYNLNEFVALELLTTAQQQMPQYPGLPRGLVAILLYYDGRKALVSALKDLMQARVGVSWCTDLSSDVTHLITSYTDSLVTEGVLKKIINEIESLDIVKELDLLTKNRALGPPKHHRMVLDLFEEIRQNLAMSLFNFSAQSGLPKDVTIQLIQFLKKCKPSGPRGEIDNVTTTLIFALFYALDISVIHRREDGEEIVRRLPIISDSNFIEEVMQELLVNEDDWQSPGLRSLIVLSLGLACGTLRLAPQNLYANAQRFTDKDEELIDIAIHLKVFDFLNFTFLDNCFIFKTEFFYRRLHIMFTDFIEIMHSKVTELRARADETARTVQNYQQQGLEAPSNVDNNFANLLCAIGKFYENDELHLNLSLEYWGPMELTGTYHRTSSRSVCLFKFMRLAGELLPQILFIPYLKMLAGLSGNQQSARNAFNLLKQGNGQSGAATVSWDHFFSSLARYYQTLRNEQQPGIDTVYRSRAFSRNISPQEIAGIQAVLHVIKTVALHDDVARVALCEQPNYAPMPVMLGLISCSIIVPLKANLVSTLAALGKSSETAIQLWNLLETSQIICTIPSTSNFGNRGIESELEEIESRNETYPLTRAILELLYTLASVIVPKTLGAGPRKPGLDPYVNFVIDTVFLKFYNRNYKDAQEKWEVAMNCLQICDMFMRMYEIVPRDFSVKEENSPPGFHIMLALHTKSEFLRLLLHLIDEACLMMDTYAPFPGKKQLENTTLYALRIMEMALAKQDAFLDAHFTANSSILLTGLNKLVFDINPRSGKSDHLLNIAKMITYTSTPQHSLMALKIIRIIIRQPNVNNQLLGVFTSNDRVKLELRQGFVESLETDGTEEIETDIKEEILGILNDSLSQAAPNIAHYLLGFDISKDIRLSNLQHPGVLDFPSTCSKSLVTILDQNLGRIVSESQQKLLEHAYELLNHLCSNSKTSEVFLRYLRSSNDFLSRHIAELPFANSSSHHVLNQMSWLMKCVAIELKLTAEKNQLSQFGNLCKILLGTTQNVSNTPENFQMELGHYGVDSASQKKSVLLICELLNSLEFEMKPLDRPKWDFFDNSLMQQLFQSCETVSPAGVKLIDVKKIHAVLKEELNSVQTTIAAGQRQYILQEIESIMSHALAVNQQKLETAANVNFLDSWSQVTEIMFSMQPTFFFTSESKQVLIVEIIQALLKHVVPAQVAQIVPDLSNLASSTVLLMLMNLRTCFVKKSTSDSSLTLFQTSLNTSQEVMMSPRSNLQYILSNIVEWIIVSGVGSQRLRMNLYAALLNFIYIVKGEEKVMKFDEPTDFYVSRLDRTIMRRTDENDDESQIEMAVEILQSFGDKLIDILCHDSTGGHDVVKMLALSCIDLLLDIDNMTNFIQFVSSRGYLAHIIDSLLKTDQKLCRVLDNQPESLKALYVYESKMAMLSRFAGSYIGAELLLEHRVIGILSQMKVFDLHPDFQISNINENSFVPPIDVRYQQILFPALNLCDVILLTLGPENQSVITQITHFLLSHADIIEIVLRAGTPAMNLGLLQELSAITGLIARVANQNISDMIDPSGNHDVGAHLYRLQKLMMTLFSRFTVTDANLKEVQLPMVIQVGDDETIERQSILRRKTFLQVAANLALYARNCIANHSVDHRTTKVLFAISGDGFHGRDTIEMSPDLNVVVVQLKNSVEFYNREKMSYDGLLRQRKALPTISLDAKVVQQHQTLTERLVAKNTDLKLCVFITEHCLYLLWAHLDYFMLRGINSTLHGFGDANFGSRVSNEDIAKLKQSLVTIFNETFSKQLLGTTQDQTASDKGFVDSLLRRIKRLVQFVPVN